MSQLKKLLSIIIVMIMSVSLLPVVVSADGTEVVYLTVENTTYSASEGAPWDGKLLDCVPVEIIEGDTKIVDVIISGFESEGYSQTGAEIGYISDINGLGEFSGGKTGGWMVSLNDWFINAGIDSFYVSDGDLIQVMFTSAGFGEDIGSSWANNNKNLSDIAFSEGVLDRDFSSDVFEYTLTIPSTTEYLQVTPTAENKNFQTRIYLNAQIEEGDLGKYIVGEEEWENQICGISPPEEIPAELSLYKRMEEIPVADGDIIYVACGLPYWNSMNNGEFGSGAESLPGTVYSFTIEKEDSQINFSAGIYDYTAVSYKEDNTECSAVTSESGIIYEGSFSAPEDATVLDALKTMFESEQIPYSLDQSESYISSVNGLSEYDCTPQSGWMISVNDEFLSVGANEAVLCEGDIIKLHYSVEGWGTDIGNYFTGGPSLEKLVLGGVTTRITSNTELDGDGSLENPFIIPVIVSSRTDISALSAEIETTLHEKYLVIGGDLEEADYSEDVTFSIETLGGYFKTYYTIKVTKKSSGGGGGGGGSSSSDEEEKEVIEQAPPEEKEEPIIHTAFQDTKGHWAEDYIERLVSEGIINGKTETEFAPDDKITRAELVTLLYRLSGEEIAYTESKFSDIEESDWYMQAISWAEENGIATGTGNGKFSPDAFVSREQTAVFIIRFCEYMGYELSETESTVFTDSNLFSAWAEESIGKAQKYGIINGFEDGTFSPKETSTRAQTAKMLCTLIDGKEENSDSVIANTAKNIISNIKVPYPGSVGGEWAIIGIARSDAEVSSDYFDSYYTNLENYVVEKDGVLHSRKYTEYSRVILAVTAIGKDPRDVAGYNLLVPLGDFEKTVWQGINGPVWALIALDCGNYDIPENEEANVQATREMYIEYILEHQNEDAGWSLTENAISETDITAMALQALSKYRHIEAVDIAINRALTLLQNSQNENGGYATSGATTCESSAQVLTALCMLGIDYDLPEFTKNGKTVLDDILSYRKGVGFSHVKNGEINQMATEQAFYSLVALDRYKNSKTDLYTMND